VETLKKARLVPAEEAILGGHFREGTKREGQDGSREDPGGKERVGGRVGF